MPRELHCLSPREFQVANHITKGMTNRDIGDKLFISERTVKFHAANIYKKLNLKNRAGLISGYVSEMQRIEKLKISIH
ncbi:MAG: Transcriptional regulatory protein DegU [Glaciecola sp. HTCC2999]|jgi:DNA-binding NarL/FixJ family response regulator|nr:MAG: Transcriptional regulatory protein DegU [Glaciecola sp. HTCC2999]